MTPEALAALHVAAFQQDRPWSTAEFRDLLANPLTRLEAAPHGFALWRGVAGEAELLTIAVHPAHRGGGIGGQLMQAWMTSAAQSCTTAFLEVASDNEAAIALYRRYSFETAAKRVRYYRRATGHTDALILRATLSASGSGEPAREACR